MSIEDLEMFGAKKAYLMFLTYFKMFQNMFIVVIIMSDVFNFILIHVVSLWLQCLWFKVNNR